jgi:hypothetical protein
MTWTRLDDGFFDHPKVRALSDHAFRIYVGMLVYSNRFLTDGELSANSARAMVGRSGALEELLKTGLAVCSDGSDGRKPGTVILHDFHEYQQDRDTVRARREAAKERVRRFRERKRNAVTGGVTDVTRNGVRNASPTRPDPISVGTESASGSSTTHSPSAPRKRDAIWDGFAEWLGRQPDTRSERGAWNSAAKELRDIGVTDPADIVNRGRVYERSYPTITWTPNGLVKHWSELNGTATRPSEEAPPETCDYGEGVVCGRCGAIHGPLSIS